MDAAKIVAAAMLGLGGCVALYMKDSTIAASCFAFLGGWLLRNGYNAQKKTENA